MDESTDWAFPERAQPKPEEVRFDLACALDAAVLLRVEVPEDAFTASILGTERIGNGVVIREDGLVLTIGYLITEAQMIWLTTNTGAVVAGHPLAYDQVTGFGLVQPLGQLGAPALARGSIASCSIGDDVIVIGQGGRAHALKAAIIAKREFAGYWEYVLDEAVFTAPPHPQWGGAGLLGVDGRLLGIGSLFVQEATGGEPVQGNMFVPIDLLEPIFEDMLRLGRPAGPARPWLGMYTTDEKGRLMVGGIAKGGPAARAGVRVGDIVIEVAGRRVTKLPELFRNIWRIGVAGAEVPLTLAREGSLVRTRVRSADRNDFLKKPQVH
ncbi:MAG TPA: S1C family serine protease [Gemmatimonadaceae bacterium]